MRRWTGAVAILMTPLAWSWDCPAAARGAAAARDVRAEFAAADGQAYETLERAEVRGWGDHSTLRPLFDLRHQLRHVAKGSDAEKLLLRALPDRWAAIQEGFLKKLRLEPTATISFDEQGRARSDPEGPVLTVYAGVPTAIVLRLLPAAPGGKLTISSGREREVEVNGQELVLCSRFAQLAVLPITASGKAGRRAVELKLAVGGESSIPISLDVRPSGTLRGTVMRAGTGEGLTAKVFVEEKAGRLYVLPGERNYRTQSWYAPWQPRFSYVGGKFAIPLPPGTYRVTAVKGYGWRDWAGSVKVQAGKTAQCRIEMQPLRGLEQDGWFCGDMHIHHRGGPTLAQLRAEDVNVAANTLYSSRKSIPLPFYRESSDAAHLSTSNQEIEHWSFGNVFYFNIPRTVLDPKEGRPEITPMFHYDEQAHAMGGIALRWLRARPFSKKWHGQGQPELAVSAALGHMDCWGVLENSMQNLLDSPQRRWNGDGWGGRLYENTYRTWYALANCGLRIAVHAGTSYGRLSRVGFNRVYCKVPGRLTNASWAAALKRGDGFVTNGPLLWLRANGKLPGDGVALPRPGKVKLAVELASRHPVRLVEIVSNGEVILRRDVADAGKGLLWEQTVAVERPSWFAARCFGEHEPRYVHMACRNQFAHTNMLFVTVGGKRPRSAADAGPFVKEIDALIGHAPKLATEEMRTRSIAEYRKARAFFARQAGP